MRKHYVLHAMTAVGCVACAILLCAAQTSFFPHYLNDAILVPDLLLCMCVGIGVFAGRYAHIYGTLFGIFAGILADGTGGCGIFLLPLLYVLCAYGAYVCADLFPKRKFTVYLSFGAVASVLRVIVAILYVLLSGGSVPIPDVVRYVCIPLFFGTSIALLPLFPASWILTLPVRKIKHQNIDKFT
ncbi:MAG: hypothetical protein II330_04005 [Clostridia bacterium]|nr:hypothetical protein [Clostridia bacterium]